MSRLPSKYWSKLNTDLNLRESRYQSFLVLSSFATFSYFSKKNLSLVVFWTKSLVNNSFLSSSHLNILIVLITSKDLSNASWRYKQNNLLEEFQILQFSIGTVFHVCVRSKNDLKNSSTKVGGGFLKEFFVLAKIGLFAEIWIITNSVKWKWKTFRQSPTWNFCHEICPCVRLFCHK